jgi:hypothetical protein
VPGPGALCSLTPKAHSALWALSYGIPNACCHHAHARCSSCPFGRNCCFVLCVCRNFHACG